MFGGFALFKNIDKHLNYILTLFHLLLDSLAKKIVRGQDVLPPFMIRISFVFLSIQSRIVECVAGLWTGSF